MVSNTVKIQKNNIQYKQFTDAGIVHKVSRCNKPAMPLIAYAVLSDFKLFLLDVGLLAAMGNLDIQTLIAEQSLFEEFKGALAEQYVLQQFKTVEQLPIYYWTAEKATAEVDFLIQYQNRIIPVEVKAAENLKAKSLKAYQQKFNPEISIRTSLSDYRKEDWLINLPLYACVTFLDEKGIVSETKPKSFFNKGLGLVNDLLLVVVFSNSYQKGQQKATGFLYTFSPLVYIPKKLSIMKPTIEEFIHLLAENIEELEVENIKPDTNYKDTPGWNSLNALLIMALLETEFNVSLSVEQLRKCTTVEELYNLIP